MRFSVAFLGEQHEDHDELDPKLQHLEDFMVGNPTGNWNPTKAKIKTTYDRDLKGHEVAIWWPGRTHKGECNDLRDEKRGCWFRSRLLSDPGCILNQRCLHFATHDGEPTLSYTCPTWVKTMDGTSSKLPDRWQACPKKFNLARVDTGIPQEFKQAMSQTCGLTIEENSLLGRWMGGTPAESMTFKISGTGLAELRVDIESQPKLSSEGQNNVGVGQPMGDEHMITELSHPGMIPHSKVKKMSGTLRKDGEFFHGELFDEQESPLGKEISIQISENGTIISWIKQGKGDWGSRVEAIKEVATTEGNAHGSPCMFPFEYEGVQQHECITAGYGRPWCKTDLSGGWGICKDQVPHKMKEVIGTHGGSSVSSGPRCLLPFTHKGKSYDSCAVLSDLAKDSPACITDSKGSWGYCNCEVASGAKGEVRTHGGTANGASCKFPFMHEGKEYSACGDLGHGAPACLTDDSGGWGYCNCKKPLTFMGPLMQDMEEVAQQAQQEAIDEEGAKGTAALTTKTKPTHRRCTGSTTGKDDAKLLFDIHHNAWYRCTQQFRCEPFDIRSIHEEPGQVCGEHQCGKHEFCFEHRVTSKRSTYECVAGANVFLLGDGDDVAKFAMPEAGLAAGTLLNAWGCASRFRNRRRQLVGGFL